MGILTDDMKRLVDEQKLAFHPTVCPDGLPAEPTEADMLQTQRARFARLHERQVRR